MKIADKLRLRPSLLTAAKVSACPPLCHPERSRGTCGSLHHQQTLGAPFKPWFWA
jgi:hypothetical protein